MSKSYEIHVISNTHWDREWLSNFQATRMMLVDFLDNLLEILEQEPAYRAFLLDSQTVLLEDYLEIRPEARDRLTRQITQGRIWVGPWYTCPEGFIVNGESLVRNLLMGHQVAGSFGKVMKVGHTPFSYGQNSQMPQIYSGFGIDTILFYHGVSHEDVANEFIFEGADGTRILGSQMSSFARYNYYFHVYRPLVYGASIDERTWQWQRGGLFFHPAGEDSCMEHHLLLDPPRACHAEKLKDLLLALKEKETQVATTHCLAFMMGHDSSVADPIEVRIIEEGKKLLPEDTLIHSTLPDLMDQVKQNVQNLQVLRGERRIPKMMGGRLHLYSDVLSSRTRMKRMNALAEYLLQRRAEPLATLAWLLGGEYPKALLDLAWKNLLRSHAHDSIAGSGVDDIERDVTDRIRQARNIALGVESRALQIIQKQIDNSTGSPEGILLTLYNPSLMQRDEIITVVIDLPRDLNINNFALQRAGENEPVPLQLAARKPHNSVVNHAGDAPSMMSTERVTVHIPAEEIPAGGYATFQVVPVKSFARGSQVVGLNRMRNEFLEVFIQNDGTLQVLSLEDDILFDGLHVFEDSGEAGHAWMHIEPALDRVITSPGFPVQVSLEEDGPYLTRYRVDYRMEVPARLDENGGDPWRRLDGSGSSSKRSDELVPLHIRSWFTLRAGARSLEVKTTFENQAHSHRLRILFPTRLDASTCWAESAFDVVEREILFGPESPWFGGVNATFPMHRFISVHSERGGLTLIHDGLREYQVTEDEDRCIALTLMRAYEVSLTTVSKRWDSHPEMILSQCPGDHEFRYWICPHSGSWNQADVFREVEACTVPLLPIQTSRHAGALPQAHSFFELQPEALMVSALKRSEDGKGVILRIHNPSPEEIEGSLLCFREPQSVELVSLEEKPVAPMKVDGKEIPLRLGSRKIMTLKIVFGSNP